MRILFYIGIGINVIGDLLLLIYAFKYMIAFKQAKRMPVKMQELKEQWQVKRKWAFGMMIGGVLITYVSVLFQA